MKKSYYIERYHDFLERVNAMMRMSGWEKTYAQRGDIYYINRETQGQLRINTQTCMAFSESIKGNDMTDVINKLRRAMILEQHEDEIQPVGPSKTNN